MDQMMAKYGASPQIQNLVAPLDSLMAQYGAKHIAVDPTTKPFTGDIRDNTPEAAQARSNTALSKIIPDATAGFGESVGQEQLAGGQKIVDSVQQAAEKYNSVGDIFDPKNGFQNFATKTGALLEGALGSASGAVQTIFAPLSATIKGLVSKVSDSSALQNVAVSKPISAWLDSVQAVMAPINKLAQDHPEAAKNIIDGLNVAGAMLSEKIPELDTSVGTAAKTVASDIGGGVNKLMPDINRAFGSVSPMVKAMQPSLESQVFDQSMKNAAESIYPKLTPKEKANIQLKDTGGLFNKSVPDLVNDPTTKPIVEAVANLPEDIKLKPSDSIVLKEDKLNQGINRLHQGTDGYLLDPLVKARTGFNDATFDSYMTQKVLEPVAREFGLDSFEYKAAQDAISTSKGLIESNDAHGVYQARQDFQAVMKDKFPSAFKKQGTLGGILDPKASARIEQARTVRTALNDFISDKLLEPTDPYRPRLKNESSLIDAKEQMRKRSISQLDKTPIVRALERSPKVKKALDYVVGAAKVGTGVKAAGTIISGGL